MGAASNPRDPARSPGLAPRAVTRPPTGPITRGKTNKGSYYTLLMKDTKGEGGQAGHHRDNRALTDPSLPHHHHPHPHLHPKPATSTARMPLSLGAIVVVVVVGGGFVTRSGASWPVNWVSPLREHVAQQGLTGGRVRGPWMAMKSRYSERVSGLRSLVWLPVTETSDTDLGMYSKFKGKSLIDLKSAVIWLWSCSK